MVIKSYKICPECGHRNLPEWIECEKCEADLQRVKVSLENSFMKVKSNEEKSFDDLQKICPTCQYSNKANAKVCEKCQEDLTLIIAQNSLKKAKRMKLISDDELCEINIDSDYILLGRVISKYPYLATKGCVSRKHAKIMFFNDKLTIKNCEPIDKNRPVITFINDQLLKENERRELKNGDWIGFGGKVSQKYEHAAYFRVVIE